MRRPRSEGSRIEVLYVRPADKPDRYAAFSDSLGQYAIGADRQLNTSAAETGGYRHWRFVTNRKEDPCRLIIGSVTIGAADDDTFDATVRALLARGYNRADRKYLLFVDSNVYCGIGSIFPDSRPGQINKNNGTYPQFARVDENCWGYAPAHELMHNLGGVQLDAPHATPYWHCTDVNDVMCYDDDGSGPVFMRDVCIGRSDRLFDCNHDDYFLAGIPASSNYLATHWNTARSSFLIGSSSQLLATVPDVIGVPRAAAAQMIDDAGLLATFTGATGSNTWVISQSPQGGAEATPGSTVTLRMSTGQPQ